MVSTGGSSDCSWPAPLNPARVTRNQSVIDRGRHDRFEQAVCLGQSDSAYPGVEQLLAPAPHMWLSDIGDRAVGERKRQVTSQKDR